MLAHGVSVELLVGLVNNGLATAHAERMMAGSKPKEREGCPRWITEAGRRVLAGRA